MEFLIHIQKMIVIVEDHKQDVLMEDLTLEDRKEIKCDPSMKSVGYTSRLSISVLVLT
jgi:predicted Zn-dependent protease with MMP-like domain